MSQHQTFAIAVPHVEGVDPATIAQIAQLAVQAAAAIKAKNYLAAMMIGLQIAGLIAQMFPTPTPGPAPLPPPTPLPTPPAP